MNNTILRNVLLGSTALVATIFVAATATDAANIPSFTGPSGTNPSNIPANVPDLNSLVNSINSSGPTGINPNTMADFGTPRNYLDNGSIDVAQRGTSAITGATTSVTGKDPTGGYVADRWAVFTNVTSGAGKGQVVTASPSPLTGFVNSMNVWRDSGALTQPVCVIQEIPSNDSISLQGQQVTFSAYLQALSGLNTDNGNVVKMTILTGTGSDEGLASLTASPAVTPAWTGIATNAASANKTITTAWARYSITGTIPTAAKEIGAQICFTPTATGSGTTDGFAMVGLQFEQGSTASAYEFRPLGFEFSKAAQYFIRLNESTTSTTLQGFNGLFVTSSQCKASLNFPVSMRTAPAQTNQLTATTFGILSAPNNLTTAAALATPFSAVVGVNTTTNASLAFTTASTSALGTQCSLVSVNGTGKIDLSSDF